MERRGPTPSEAIPDHPGPANLAAASVSLANIRRTSLIIDILSPAPTVYLFALLSHYVF